MEEREMIQTDSMKYIPLILTILIGLCLLGIVLWLIVFLKLLT